MADFIELATLDQLAPGQGMTVTVRGVPVALFNVDGTVYAIDNACRHVGVSLGTGELRGNIVRCRHHGWRYDVTTGQTMHDPEEEGHALPGAGGRGDDSGGRDVNRWATAAARVGQAALFSPHAR
jgi:nitrite reductase/ring-hydroxylating ferredoxin subunit